MDGTDFPVTESTPFWPGWYSHKFKGAGVRYKIGVANSTGWLVWVNGPYACGQWPHQKIANHLLKHMLDEGETYICDGGYNDMIGPNRRPTGHHFFGDWMESLARARHETINGRFEEFKCLQAKYRHEKTEHFYFFAPCALITQLEIAEGSKIFQLEYRESEFDVDYYDRIFRP